MSLKNGFKLDLEARVADRRRSTVVQVFRAALLHDAAGGCAASGRHQGDGRPGCDARRNAAPRLPPKTSRLSGPSAARRAVGFLGQGRDGRPHRIAGDDALLRRQSSRRSVTWSKVRAPLGSRASSGSGWRGRRRHSARAALCGFALLRGEERRHGGIAAEAHGDRRDRGASAGCGTANSRQRQARDDSSSWQPSPCRRRRRQRYDAPATLRQAVAEALPRSSVTRSTRQPRPQQRFRQRFGREHVAAGAAGREQDLHLRILSWALMARRSPGSAGA